jgi:SAM-dependent MidA family methyltransferase
MLGRQMEEMWEKMGRPPAFHVVEAGGGRGYLAMDMLDYLKGREIYGRLAYTLVELNPVMAERQKALLAGHGERVRWARGLGELTGVRGCVLSNELLDAFPVHLVEMREGPVEVYVSVKDGAFVEETAPPSTGEITAYLGEFSASLPPGYRTEVNLRMRGWLREVSEALSEGFLLTIDYGYPAWEYYSEERTRGTLLCYRGHQVSEDPYRDVGRQDITAHVNFSALKRWGEEEGLSPVGFCRQGVYLVSLGIDEVLAGGGPGETGFDTAKVKGLIMPGTMGETHRVMIQYRGELRPGLRGFEMKNQLSSL